METPYVVRVMQQTPTRLWINNPTLGELKRGKDWQVVGATTNPTYSMKMLKNAEMGESVRETLRHYGGDIQVTSDAQETVFSGTVPKDTTIPEAKAAQENSTNA